LVAVQRNDDGKAAMAMCLLEMGASTNLQDNLHKTALHWAVELGPTTVVDALLDEGTNMSLTDYWGETALHYAAENSQEDTIYTLMEKGSDPFALNDEGETVLWKAMPMSKVSDNERITDTMGLLLDMEADIEALEKTYGKTPLIWAAENGRLEFVRFLLDRNANVSARDCFGMTALHYAAENGHLESVEGLIDMETRPDIDARDNGRQTPLWKACKSFLPFDSKQKSGC
jgi:uncharacterized protein